MSSQEKEEKTFECIKYLVGVDREFDYPIKLHYSQIMLPL